MWHNYDGHFWGMHFMWWIFWILILIGFFVALRFPYRYNKKEDSPLDILKKRFAKGEISKEEFEERKGILERHS